ncbi:MAG TPA: beta-L-arabinofuranosidase domain-containing protein [Bryobacteraceae bacterium]|nr:beta-L-arabinofuranosidase domain-containing protein [Bryobacteraceae bacterium]
MSGKRGWVSRRNFGVALAAAGAAKLAGQQSPAPAPAAPNAAPAPAPSAGYRRGPQPEVPPFEGAIEFARKDAAAKVRPFPLAQVRLLPGVYHDHQEWNRGYMHRLEADQLLYNFRQNAGLPTVVTPKFGGWEAPADGKHGTELRGHFTGHYLSASAQLYASTGDAEAKSKADGMVADLAKCQDKLGDGYLSAFPTSLFDRLDSGRNLPWAPFYTLHKIMAGLIDMNQLAGNKQALDVAAKMGGWLDRWSAPKPEEHMQQILNTEFGGIAESLYNLTAITGEDQFARVGDRYQKKVFINPLGLRRDELRRLHVNTHVPQVIAAARRYEISSDPRFHTVADFFWNDVTAARTYVTGGTSNNEGWQVEPGRLGAEIQMGTNAQECCCVYNMLKLTRHLYSWKPDPRYFDYYERVMLNHRLGTIKPEQGHGEYYLSLTPGAYKSFGTEDQSFWCCTGTGVEEHSKLADSIYWNDEQGLYVNQFIASELDWKEKGVKVRLETRFPEEAGVALAITAARPASFALRLRVPGWLEASPTVKINGKVTDASAAPGSYLSITRAWKTGDRVEMALPMKLHVEALPDEPKMQAAMYGPLVLAGNLGNAGLTEQMVTAQGIRVNREEYPQPQIRAGAGGVEAWLKPGDKGLTFRTSGQAKDYDLAPMSRTYDNRYVVYWEVS